MGWNAPTSEITVLFDSIETDSNGNPIPQGVLVSISDGEDSNNGMLLFNVIENGAPRWEPIPTQTVFGGGYASTELAGYLSDFDENGDQSRYPRYLYLWSQTAMRTSSKSP